MTPTHGCPAPAGILVIIGGKENKGEEKTPERQSPSGFVTMDVLRIFTGLSRKKENNILVITSGSSEGAASFREYKKLFTELGHSDCIHIHHDTRQEVLQDAELVSKINEADSVFLAGGDQLLLTSLYGGTEFLSRFKHRYIAERLIVGGTSAGAMSLSTPMIYAGSEEVQQVSGEIKVTTGLEFLKDVCIDTHFVHRGRFVRLAQVIATNPGCTGLGIEEDTAVIVRHGKEAEVAGSGTIIRITGFSISGSNMKNFMDKKAFSVRSLTVDILAAGDTFTIDQLNPPHQ